MNSAAVSRRALVVTFDQLPAAILGCYGNEWIETPHLDRLAAAGITADQCWATRLGRQTAEQAFADGTGFLTNRQSGGSSVLFQEVGSQIDFSAVGFDRVESLSGDATASAKPDRIPLAVLVRAALPSAATLLGGEGGFETGLLWLHARGLTLPATPPAGFAELYQDEFEDRGIQFEQLSDGERQSHPTVAAGMMSLFDHWLGELFQQLVATAALPTLVIVTAAQGTPWQPLPNSFGPLDELRGQAVQTPLIVQAIHDDRFAVIAGLRSQELLTPADIGPLLEWWFRSDPTSPGDWSAWVTERSQHHHGRILTRSAGGAWRISSAEWGAIFPEASEESPKPALFHKPEDAWEVNNVAESFPDVVETLHNANATDDFPHAIHLGLRPTNP